MAGPGLDGVTGAGGVTGAEAAARVDQWVAQAKAKAERYQAMQVQTQQVSVTESSKDGMVTVTVDSAGNVADLRITDRSRELSGTQVAAAVLDTMRRAQAKLPEKLGEVMAATIGDDKQTVDTIVGNYRAKFPEPPPEEPPAGGGAVTNQALGRLEDDTATAPPPAPPSRPAPPRRPGGPRDEDDGWEDQSFLRDV